MKNGFVFSDLHLFASHTNAAVHHMIQHSIPTNSEYIVMNGDIFDFRWSHFKNQAETFKHAQKWLEDILAKFPETDIYYIMGNHDCGTEWGNILNTIQNPRFHWSSTHFIIDDKLFLHGDLALGGNNQSPLSRPNMKDITVPRFYTLHNKAYDFVIGARVHKPISKYFSAARTTALIYNALQKNDSAILEKIRDIYFGHTHGPFQSYQYKGKIFHNTGSAILHMPFNPLKVHHGQE